MIYLNVIKAYSDVFKNICKLFGYHTTLEDIWVFLLFSHAFRMKNLQEEKLQKVKNESNLVNKFKLFKP